MAFELPSHLPRGRLSQDKPTQVITKIGQTTHTTLTASLAASWLHELDSSIQDTKIRIYQRIHDDLHVFEQQLESSTSIRTRLSELCSTTDALTDLLYEPTTGILPRLLQTLTAHGIVSTRANDSEAIHRITAHLFHIQKGLCDVSAQLLEGQLLESAQACVRVQKFIADAPEPLEMADIMNVVRKKYRTLNDRLQEQLGDAYAQSVRFTTSGDAVTFTVLSSTKVPPTSTMISLSAILQSLGSDALSIRLSSLRRDLMSNFVDKALVSLHPITETASNTSLSLSLSSTSSTPLQSLKTLITFLYSRFFPHLPPTHIQFPTTLYAPITTAVLTHLLKPSIPSSLPELPSFLKTADEAVQFEDYLLSGETRDRPIRHWVEDVAGHYEKKRRESFLRLAREVISGLEGGSTFRVALTVHLPSDSGHLAIEDTNADAWGFDEEQNSADASTSQKIQEQNGRHDSSHTLTPEIRAHEEPPRTEDDSSDGWGWGDGADGEADETGTLQDEPPLAEAQNSEPDDPWDDDGWSINPVSPAPELGREALLPVSKTAPKMATRLEKFSAKSKGLGTRSPSTEVWPAVPQMAQRPPSPPQSITSRLPKKLPQASPSKEETYVVSSRARKVLDIVENVMQEGQELLNSRVLARHSTGKMTVPGQLLLAAAPSILDLHRALHMIVHWSSLEHDLNLVMRWSNECKFLGSEAIKLQHVSTSVEERWTETIDRLNTLGESCYELAVARQQEAVRNILLGAQRFVQVSSAERYEECKSTIEQVLHEITIIAHQWKETLTQTGYTHAMGQVVDDTLFQIMDAILSLEDIPEVDSERLSELCELLTPIEELFVFVPGEQSVVGRYVPLWFKFSYLPWLLKGSIADLSYLFDQGMLVDYEIGELTRLLRALFSETPLRENTIAKIAQGHPLTLG